VYEDTTGGFGAEVAAIIAGAFDRWTARRSTSPPDVPIAPFMASSEEY
jgi:hypothetical protein